MGWLSYTTMTLLECKNNAKNNTDSEAEKEICQHAISALKYNAVQRQACRKGRHGEKEICR